MLLQALHLLDAHLDMGNVFVQQEVHLVTAGSGRIQYLPDIVKEVIDQDLSVNQRLDNSRPRAMGWL